MTYVHLTHGRTAAQIREIDGILRGPADAEAGPTPLEIARENRQAMATLGQVGMVRRPKK